MAVLKCEMCGGELDLNADMTVGICQYCGGKNIIPKDMDKKEKLYNYATHLRQNNEFDRAVRVYEDLLKEDNSNAEAHWGMLLSKLAIEYVKDPATGEMLPTCHRGQMESILVDTDYKAVMEYASSGSQKYYEEKAKQIAGIQEKMLEIAKKEPPYDIFICYKELDENGERTDDSVLAQDIYEKLCKKGYRVFFARKTLQHKLGTEYEPYIFSALNSSRVMIVVGTKTEHLESAWVRNEWSRYHKLAHKENSEKVMICAYKGMSPYELPTELAILQGQDMDTIGGMQNLCDGVELLVGKNWSGKDTKKEENTLERLIKNGKTYLTLDNYTSAEGTYQELTRKYPEAYQGWWGLIIAKTRNLSVVMSDIASLNSYFQSVKTLCPAEQFEAYEKQYANYLLKVSSVEALKEITDVKNKISIYRNKIADKEQIVQDCELKKSNKVFESKFEKKQASLDKRISSLWKERDREQMRLTSSRIRRVVGIIAESVGLLFIVSGLISLTESLATAVLGMVIGGAVMYYSLGIFSFIDQNSTITLIKEIDEQIQAFEIEKQQEKQSYENETEKLNTKQRQCRTFITENTQKIRNCTNYLNCGKDAITQLLFAKNCKAVGITQKVDEDIKKYRELVMNGSTGADIEKKTADMVHIICPACGHGIDEIRSKVIDQGYVICEDCQSMIEVDVSR